MSKKELEKFDPAKLRPGRSWSTEIVRPDGYHEAHYFYRDADGELFTTITKNHNSGDKEKNAWLKRKREQPRDEQITSIDELLKQAKQHCLADGIVSVSYLQRTMQIGYTRAASLLEIMIADGFCKETGMTHSPFFTIVRGKRNG